MRPTFLAAAAVLCLASCSAEPAFAKKAPASPPPIPAAPAAPACVSADVIIERAKAMVEQDGHSELLIYADQRAAKLRDYINAIEPATNFTADRIVVMTLDDHHPKPAALIMFVTGKCVSHAFPALPFAQWREMLKIALGTDA
jgi:hypothetical protein